MAEHKVVVVGAGMAGLVSALQLADQGLSVTVVDKAEQVGGKMRQLMPNGVAVDSGPTVFTMRWVFDQIMASVGTRLESELTVQRLDVLARHFWEDGSQLDLYADPQRSVDAVARFAGPEQAKRFVTFCKTTRAVYDALEGPFIRSPSPTMAQMMSGLGPRGLATLASVGPMRSLWESLGKHFTDPRMRQLFARYATYCGSSPWQAPATLMLIAQVEMDGVWAVQGGMHALAQCLQRLGQARGVRFILGQECERIELSQGRVSGVRMQSGDSLQADSVVFNGDIAALRQGLLGPGMKAAVAGKNKLAHCLPLLGLCTRPPRVWPWTGTMFFFARTTPKNSRPFFSKRGCRRNPRSMFVPKTVAPAKQSMGLNACCVWSMRLPMAISAVSPPKN